METKSLGIILLGKNSGSFKNDKDVYCTIVRCYDKNICRYKITFADMNGISNRYAISTVSEKKVLKFLLDEKFSLLY